MQKGYLGLLGSALHGVPNTAMLPKAGFPELSAEEVASTLRYMLSTLRLSVPHEAPAQPRPQAPAAAARVDDATLVANVAEALRRRVAPRGTVEGARIAGITVEARDGRVALRGMVDSAKVIRDAEEAARGVSGVVAVENNLVGADLFEHD